MAGYGVDRKPDNGFNPYAAGKKKYGVGRTMPTVGKVSDKAGYTERDAKMKARKEALIRRASGQAGRGL